MNKRTVLEVNLSTLKSNYQNIKKHIGKDKEIIAVVKANAYGMGDIMISKSLYECGVRNFAVATLEEGVHLRKSGVINNSNVIILGYTPPNEWAKIYKYDLIQTLVDEEYAHLLSKQSKNKIKCVFAINTGMNRLGLNAQNEQECINIIEKYTSIFDIKGVFSHLSVADAINEENIKFTHLQIDKFSQLTKRLSKFNFEMNSLLNSAGSMYYNYCKAKFVRIGILLYGLKPDYNNHLPIEVKQIFRWKSVISRVAYIERGDCVGYGRSYIASKKTKIAIVSVGYADGYNRLLSNKGIAFIKGKKVKVIGKVCMDQITLDVSNINDVNTGDEVILLDENYTADDMANLIGTIGYEVVCNISNRVERKYIK